MGRMNELDKILEKRSVPEMSDNLVSRIVATARPELFGRESTSVKERRRGWLGHLFDGILMPQPALVLSLFLLAGLFIGTTVDLSTLSAQDDMASYLYINDDDGYGDWL